MLKIEDQIAQLADAIDTQLSIDTPERRAPGRTSQWMLGAAAAAVLGLGLTALLATSSRDTAPTSPADSAVAGLPDVDAGPFRFAEPLDADVVPILDPPPAEPESIVQRTPFEWVSGIESLNLFGVVDESGALGVVVVLETAVSWDALSDGLDVTKLNGVDAVVVRSENEPGVFLRNGDVTRAVFDVVGPNGDSGPPDVSADALEIANLIGDRPFDQIPTSERIVRLPGQNAEPVTVRYGSPPNLVLIRQTIPASTTADELAVLAELVQTLHSPSDSAAATRFFAFEQVSPVDLIVVVAATQEAADDAIANVEFVERAADDESVTAPTFDQVIARGEPSWGRWEVATQTDDPTCWLFAATLWGPSNNGDAGTGCADAGATPALPSAFCLRLDDRIVGALLDTEATPEFVGATDAVTFEEIVERSDTSVSFEIRDPMNPTAAPRVNISVDGAPLTCGS